MRIKKPNALRLMRVIVPVFLHFSCSPGIQAQSHAEIQNIDFSMQHDSIFISYNLLKAAKNERFDISLIVTTASGKTINPLSVTGDVGKIITGGQGKKITWDINKDNVFINEGISVEITAQPMAPEIRFVHRGTAALLSAVVPGLGITKLNNGGPYWIMAIAFYGSAAGSYLYYQSAESDYDKYKASLTESERNDLYGKVENKDRISDVLMYTARTIWVKMQFPISGILDLAFSS